MFGGPNFGLQKFLFGNLDLSVTRYHGQLSLCTTSEKTNDPFLRKFSDGQMEGQTEVQTGRRMRVIP